MITLTALERETYDVICAFLDAHGFPPSFREIGELLDLQSSSTVYQRIDSLRRKGVIACDPRKARTLRVLLCPLPPTGEVA